MGTEIDAIVEFEEVLDLPLDDTPTVNRASPGALPALTRRNRPAEICRQSDDAVQRAAVPRTFHRRQGPDSTAWNIFSLRIRQDRAARAIASARAAQVLHNLPAGDWAAGERGIAILPDRVDEFREASRAQSTTPRRSTANRSTAWSASHRTGADRRAERVLIANLHFAAEHLARTDPASDRADKHARYPRLLSERHRTGVQIIDDVGRAISSSSTISTTCS